MILLPCPHCGKRNSNEFSYLGESAPRPTETGDAKLWRAYLYTKENPAGWTRETWLHSGGCGKAFLAERHSVTNEVRATWLPGRKEPDTTTEAGS